METRLRHFDDHISSQKQKKRHEDTRKQDLEDQLANVRERHNELLARQGALTAEANVRKNLIVGGLCIITFLRHKVSEWRNGSNSSTKSVESMISRVLVIHHWKERKSLSLFHGSEMSKGSSVQSLRDFR